MVQQSSHPKSGCSSRVSVLPTRKPPGGLHVKPSCMNGPQCRLPVPFSAACLQYSLAGRGSLHGPCGPNASCDLHAHRLFQTHRLSNPHALDSRLGARPYVLHGDRLVWADRIEYCHCVDYYTELPRPLQPLMGVATIPAARGSGMPCTPARRRSMTRTRSLCVQHSPLCLDKGRSLSSR